MTDEPRRLRLGALVLLCEPAAPPRLWRVCGVEGDDAAAEHFLTGQVFMQGDLAAWCAGRIDVVQLGARRLGL